MAKTKDNNHYVSEFHLRHFRITPPPPKHPGKYWVYVYQADSDIKPVNAGKVGAAHQFYGSEDDQLENLFAVMESRAGTMFSDIARNPEGVASHAIGLGDFIWIQSFRTKAIRERLRGGFARMTEQLASKTESDVARDHFRSELNRLLDAEIDKWLSQFSVFERVIRRKSPEFQSQIRLMKAKIEKALNQGVVANTMQEGLRDMAALFKASTMVDAGHNDGLKGFLESGGSCPDSIRPKNWTVVNSERGQFVLGDATTFGVSEQGRISPLIGMSSDWHEVYLPLNPFITVVGTKHKGAPTLDPPAIISAAIATSHEQFFASALSEELAAQIPLINTMGELIEEEEMREIVGSVWGQRG